MKLAHHQLTIMILVIQDITFTTTNATLLVLSSVIQKTGNIMEKILIIENANYALISFAQIVPMITQNAKHAQMVSWLIHKINASQYQHQLLQSQVFSQNHRLSQLLQSSLLLTFFRRHLLT